MPTVVLEIKQELVGTKGQHLLTGSSSIDLQVEGGLGENIGGDWLWKLSEMGKSIGETDSRLCQECWMAIVL
jgi:hypothetical protein